MATRIELAGGRDSYLKLMDSFFGFQPDGTPKPPVTQLPMMGGAKFPNHRDLSDAGFDRHSYEG